MPSPLRRISDSLRRSVRRNVAASSTASGPARRSDVRRWAEERSLQFSAWDSLHLPDLPFSLFRRGEGQRRCHNLISGEWQGLDLRAADFQFHVVQRDRAAELRGETPWRPQEFDLFFSVVLVPTGTPTASRVFIAPGDIRPWRVGEDLTDVQIDPPDFDRLFTVRAASPPFARQLLLPASAGRGPAACRPEVCLRTGRRHPPGVLGTAPARRAPLAVRRRTGLRSPPPRVRAGVTARSTR